MVLPALALSLAAWVSGPSFSLPLGAELGTICRGGWMQPRAEHVGMARAAFPEGVELLMQQFGSFADDVGPVGPVAAEVRAALPDVASSLQQWAHARVAALPPHLLTPVPPAYAADTVPMPPDLDPNVKYLFGADGELLLDPMTRKPLVDDWWNAFVGFQSGLVRGLDQQLRNLGVKEAFGWSVVIYTIFIKLLLYPTIAGSARTTALNGMMGPKIKELQEKYKGNEEAFSRRLEILYKAFDFNPLGGCFPLLVQLPVIIALYSIWRRLCTEKFEHYAEPWLWVPSLAQPNPEWQMKVDWLFAFDGSEPIIGWSEYLRYLVLPATLIGYTFYTSILTKPPVPKDKEKDISAVEKFSPWFILLLMVTISVEFPQVALVYYSTNYFTNAMLTEVAKSQVRKEFPMLETFEKTGKFPDGNFDEVLFGPETLHEACRQGNPASIKALLAEGQDINSLDENKATPVVYAVAGGHLNLVPVLAMNGADLMVRDGEGNSLFHVAAHCGRLDALQYIVKFLTSMGQLKDDDDWPSWTNARGMTVLDLALRSGGDVADFVQSRSSPAVAPGDGAVIDRSSATAPAQPQSPAELAVRMLMQRMASDAPRPPPEVVGGLLRALGIPTTEENLRLALQTAAGPDAGPPSPEELAAAGAAAALSEEVGSAGATSVPNAPPAHAGGGSMTGTGASGLVAAGSGRGGGVAAARAVD